MKISYVSHQVYQRVAEFEWKSNRRVDAPLKQFDVDEVQLKIEQRLTGDDVVKYRVDQEFSRHPDWVNISQLKLPINMHIWRKGFGLKNLVFTPYGVNADEYKSDVELQATDKDVNMGQFTCGYAGWAKYILGKQREHRRTHWILEAQNHLGFKVEFAGGLKQFAGPDVEEIKRLYNTNPKINIDTYTRESIHKFYSKLHCYLVPDKWAGGPMPVLEAALFGIPIVTTNCGLCGDIIKHKQNGYLVNSKEEFIEGIKFFQENPEARINIGQNLKRFVLEKRSWAHVAPEWRRFFTP
jgi:hypothetical protein